MFFYAFLGGLIAVLTPNVLFMILILSTVFSDKNISENGKLRLIGALTSLILIFYFLLGLFLANSNPGMLNSISSNSNVKYVFILSNLIVAVWFLVYSKLFNANTKTNRQVFVLIMIIIWLLFFATTLSGLGPIIGSILVSKPISILDKTLPLTAYGLGLMLPIGFIVYFLSNFLSKRSDMKWFKVSKFIIGLIIILSSIYKLIIE